MRFPALQRAIVGVLQDAREGKKLSQRALSAALKEENNFIQRIESLERDVSAAEFAWIVRTIGEDPAEKYAEALRRAKY